MYHNHNCQRRTSTSSICTSTKSIINRILVLLRSFVLERDKASTMRSSQFSVLDVYSDINKRWNNRIYPEDKVSNSETHSESEKTIEYFLNNKEI